MTEWINEMNENEMNFQINWRIHREQTSINMVNIELRVDAKTEHELQHKLIRLAYMSKVKIY